ncbi:hypothetical protein [[Clostridium] fimetarium]|uniref:Uncharacterized protein n=1 Tax=[Clostridium] fimetarium TaxID=99656 RepID=A0A1I0RKP2_9FIRM|nr:hypothetical protein [[Clostridium] fimetarium]SEW41407.1 hypothetical protein SAMN05421659_11745 [[Clostridium] fimetarium]
MKCPKCGNEYDGVSCPQCKGAKVIINDNDYLRRKKEYEENGKILGIKVKKDPLDIHKFNADKEIESEFLELPKVNDEIKKLKSIVNKTIKKHHNKKSNKKKKNSTNKIVAKALLKKYWLKASIFLITIIIIIIAGTGVYGLIKRFNMTLYIVGTDGRICTGGSLENKLISNVSDVIFSLDGESFYEEKLPSEISDKTIIFSYASQKGDYFVAEVYDNVSTYTLYVWSDGGVKKIIEGTNEKEVKYISDSGRVLFTDITYLYAGAVSNIGLYEYDAAASIDKSSEKGVLSLIEKNIRSQYLYLKNSTLVYLDSSNALYTINFAKLTDKTLVAKNINDIYGVSNEMDNLYSNSTAIVKDSGKSEAFIYSQSGEFYYYEVSSEATTYLFDSTLSGVEIIYEKSHGDVYCISMSNISYGTIKNDSVTEMTSLDNMSSTEDKCYYPDTSTLVYVTKVGQLVSVNRGNKTAIRSGVSSESLNLVRNSVGLTYIADGVQYYRNSLAAAEIKLQELASGNDTSQSLIYKNNIYFMSAQGELCYCSLKGKDFSTFGPVTSFWVK